MPECRWSIAPARFAAALTAMVMALALAGCGSEAADPQGPQDDVARFAPAPVTGPELQILAFGDSLFAGYNVARDESYPARLQNALRARGINAVVANAGISGDTTAAGLQRLPFTLNSQPRTPDLVILELGGNDLLRGVKPAETRANMDAMLSDLRARGIPVLIMGMRSPPNYGAVFASEFDRLYSDLAKKHDADLVPFFLEDIYDQPELIQPDRIHPTAEGIERLVASTVDEVVDALPEPANDN